MPLTHGPIRPIRLTPAHLRTAVVRTARTLDAWTLQTFDPPLARRSTDRTTRVG